MDLSVIIPCHAEGSRLIDAVRSVIDQEWLPDEYEIIVIPDGVRDEATREALQCAKVLSPAVRITPDAGGRGAAAARNAGVDAASGTWLAFLDADDAWTPQSVRRRWEALARFPDAVWVAGDFNRVAEDGTVLVESARAARDCSPDPYGAAFSESGPATIKYPFMAFLECAPPWMGTVMLKSAIFRDAGGFLEGMKIAEDVHLWRRLALRHHLVFVPDILATYTKRSGSLTHITLPPGGWERMSFWLLLSEAPDPTYRKAIRKRLVRHYVEDMWYYRHQNDLRHALAMVLGSIRQRPWDPLLWRWFIGTLFKRVP